MNDKKTTYDKLLKHIDKAQKFIDLLVMEQPTADPYRALEKAMNDYAASVGDRHQAGIVMQGMVAQFVDRSKLAKPMTPDEIHVMNLKQAEKNKEAAKAEEIDCQLVADAYKRFTKFQLVNIFYCAFEDRSNPVASINSAIDALNYMAGDPFDLGKIDCTMYPHEFLASLTFENYLYEQVEKTLRVKGFIN